MEGNRFNILSQYQRLSVVYTSRRQPFFLNIHVESRFLYMPFFSLHALAPVVGATADGYSWIYQFLISVSALFYSLIGLIFLRKILLRYVDDKIVAMDSWYNCIRDQLF